MFMDKIEIKVQLNFFQYEIIANPLSEMDLLHPKDKWLRCVFAMTKNKLKKPLRLSAYAIIPLSSSTFLSVSLPKEFFFLGKLKNFSFSRFLN